MKKILLKIIIGLAIFSLAQGVLANAASLEKLCADSDINCWINQLQSKKLHDRERAVGHLESLYYHDKSEAAKKALIDLLERELTKIQKDGGYKGESSDEGEAEYFYSLCKIVGNFSDPKAIPLLLEIGNLDALKPYGEPVLDIIISRLDHKSYGQRLNAATVLDDFLTPKEKGYTAEGEARIKIRVALLQATKDKEGLVRGRVVIALSNFQDDEVIAVLEDIKKNDPHSHVREKAEKALEKIKKAKGE